MPEAAEAEELITAGPAEALAGLLGVPGPDDGGALPLLWHWVYLLDRPPQAALGTDGHRAHRGVPVPPGPGRRRMFAGGRVTQHAPLRTGAAASRRTWEASSAEKHGSSGALLFVTVRSEIIQDGRVVIAEEQDIVYREAAGGSSGPAPAPASPAPAPASPAPAAASPAAASPAPPSGATREWPVAVDPVLLFRFSALTYNAHRIHYDRDYARQAEGYPGLVVHGPLQALLMAELARRVTTLPQGCEYSYRLVAPLFEGQGLIVSATVGGDVTQLTVRDADGRRTAAGSIGPAGSLQVSGR
jgi:3-methylfumaryl-CoA hydratase